jgi:hypothetical protein
VTNANRPPVLHVRCYFVSTSRFFASYSLYARPTSKHKTTRLHLLPYKSQFTTIASVQDMSPFQISATQLKLSISHRHQTESCPFVMVQPLPYAHLCFSNTSYFQQLRDRMHNKRGLDSVGLHVLHSPSSIIQAIQLRRIGCEDVKL